MPPAATPVFLLGRIECRGARRPRWTTCTFGSRAFLSLGGHNRRAFLFRLAPSSSSAFVPVLAVLFELYYATVSSRLGRRDTALRRDRAERHLRGDLRFVHAARGYRASTRPRCPRCSPASAGVSAGTIGAPLAVIPVLVASNVLARRPAPEFALLLARPVILRRRGPQTTSADASRSMRPGHTLFLTMLSAGLARRLRGSSAPPRAARKSAWRAICQRSRRYLCFSQLLLFASSLVGSLAIAPLWFIATGAYFYYKNRWRILPHA